MRFRARGRPSVCVRLLVACAVAALFPHGTLAGPIGDSVQRVVAAERQATQAAGRTRMPPAYKWTGIGLLAGGGLTISQGLRLDEESCYQTSQDKDFCSTFKAVWIGGGVAMAAVGAILLAVGNSKRESVADIQFGPGAVRFRVRF